MNLLQLLPGIGTILDKVITSPKEKAELETKIKELDIREIEALTKTQSSWLSNGSLFVSGAIPAILWMLVIVILFNYILSPLLQGIFSISIPLLDLPQWYSSMCTTIVLGLFAKKAYDSTDMTIGTFSKKSKFESESETKNKNIAAIQKNNTNIAKTINKKIVNTVEVIPEEIPAANNDSGSDSDNIIEDIERAENTKDNPNYDDPEYINARFEELLKERNIKK